MKPSAYIIGKILQDEQESICLKGQGVKRGDIYIIMEKTPSNYEFAKRLISNGDVKSRWQDFIVRIYETILYPYRRKVISEMVSQFKKGRKNSQKISYILKNLK